LHLGLDHGSASFLQVLALQPDHLSGGNFEHACDFEFPSDSCGKRGPVNQVLINFITCHVARRKETFQVCMIAKKAIEECNLTLTAGLSYTAHPRSTTRSLGKRMANHFERYARSGSTPVQAKAEIEAAAKASNTLFDGGTPADPAGEPKPIRMDFLRVDEWVGINT